MQANRAKYLQTLSATEVDRAIQNATVAVQSVHMSIDRINGDGSARDAAMAAKVEWIAAHAPSGSRIVLWMHNGHIGRDPKVTGGILAQHFGSDYVTIGTAFHSGRYFACTGWGCPGKPTGVMGDFPALDSSPGSAEYFFHQTGTPGQILDLRLANANVPASSWLLGALMFRLIGYAELKGIAEFYSTSRLAQDFDALVFFDHTTATTALPNGPMSLTVFAPGSMWCGSLSVLYLQAAAPGSGSPVSLPEGTVGAAYVQTLRAGGGTCSSWPNTLPASCPKGVWPPYGNWTVTGGAIPPGLALSPDGALSGAPTQAGAFTFTVETTNNAYQETSRGELSLTFNRPRPVRRNSGDSNRKAPACQDIQRKR